MRKSKYVRLWLAVVHIKPKKGLKFKDLIDLEGNDGKQVEKFTAAWANILVKAETINEALDLLPQGLKEKSFEVVFIDRIENLQWQVENKQLSEDTIKEADWLLKSKFLFKIVDPIFPFST